MSKSLPAALLLLYALMAAAPASADARLLSAEEVKIYRGALLSAKRGNWSAAKRRAAKGDHPLAEKLFHWLDLRRPASGASFENIAQFISENPHWPDQDALRSRAEEAISTDTAASSVINWFGTFPPLTLVGHIRRAEALLTREETELAAQVLRRAWVDRTFTYRKERRFLSKFRKFLRLEDHIARLDRLLWDGHERSARRAMRRVDDGHMALAEARLRLQFMTGGVDWAIRQVPANLKSHPGLVYERLRWRRRKGRDEDARELLWDPPPVLGRPAAWWFERAIQVRRAFAAGYVTDAYRLAQGHGQTEGAAYAEAEWLAGWIALRFLDDAGVAHDHFRRMAARVRTPVSLARANYWKGRAAQALGRSRDAEKAFALAARHDSAFYGQLAALRLGAQSTPVHQRAPANSVLKDGAFDGDELVQLVRLLGQLDQRDLQEAFLLRLNETAASIETRTQAAALALEYGRPNLAVRIAKLARRAGIALLEAGYPAPPLPDDSAVERPLVLAVIRQESAFDPEALSRAGARGLMQLMPATAGRVAKTIGVRYSKTRLTRDPDYNVTLGSTYLTQMLDEFGGSYVLALAAYNAGPYRVRRWLRDMGDPRETDVDVPRLDRADSFRRDA